MTQPDAAFRLAERMYPHLVPKFYPRRYAELGQYHSPKLVAGVLAVACGNSAANGFPNTTVAERMIMPSLQYLVDHQMPLMFLAPEFLKAVLLTDFPGFIDWKTIHLPYEHGIFMLPKGALRHPDGSDCAFILYSRKQIGIDYRTPSPEFGRIAVKHDCFSLVGFVPAHGVWYDINLTVGQHGQTITQLHDVFVGYPDGPSFDLPLLTPSDAPLNEQDKTFIEAMNVVVFGSLLALSARPDLLTRGARQSVVKPKHGGGVIEYWSPNIIGAGYRLPREAPQGGTHASPRMHWRRGHYRQQPYGPKSEPKIRSIWLEPCLINAKEETK